LAPLRASSFDPAFGIDDCGLPHKKAALRGSQSRRGRRRAPLRTDLDDR
jgi:hypothetical protein